MRFVLVSLFILLLATPAQAGIIDDLKAKIFERSETIKKLDEEIKQFSTELENTKQEKQTLQSEIKTIDQNRAKLSSDIKQTEGKIAQTSQNIAVLAGEIAERERVISKHKDSLAESFRALRERDEESLVEVALGYPNLSSLLAETNALDQLNLSIDNNIYELRTITAELTRKKSQQESEKTSLASAKTKLADQKAIADTTKKTKDQLLAVTKNKESNYQQLLADRLKKKEQVESEINQFESEIKTIIDPNSLPAVGKGVLRWPLDKIVITQYFGNTAFASKNPQVYSGKGHNGVDFGTPIGTPIKAALSGTVTGLGDTDTTCQGASYGKWILVKHSNGLSTLYAHLSLIKVGQSQTVITGEIIGYSGNTGYSTGPHLHFTVFASEGVEVNQLKSKVPGCGTYTLPLASQSSYLNPLSYL